VKLRCLFFLPAPVPCALLCRPLLNGGELYIWPDNGGVTHASDGPPLENVREVFASWPRAQGQAPREGNGGVQGVAFQRIWSASARFDLSDIAAYIARDSRSAVQAFVSKLFQVQISPSAIGTGSRGLFSLRGSKNQCVKGGMS